MDTQCVCVYVCVCVCVCALLVVKLEGIVLNLKGVEAGQGQMHQHMH